jgi:hypothetical protein
MAWAISFPDSNVFPSVRAVNSEADLVAGETFYELNDPPHGKVKDAQSGAIRNPNAAELLERAKNSRRFEIARTADQDAAAIMSPGQYQSVGRRNANDQRVRNVDAVYDRLDQILTAIDNANSQQALEAITWHR